MNTVYNLELASMEIEENQFTYQELQHIDTYTIIINPYSEG